MSFLVGNHHVLKSVWVQNKRPGLQGRGLRRPWGEESTASASRLLSRPAPAVRHLLEKELKSGEDSSGSGKMRALASGAPCLPPVCQPSNPLDVTPLYLVCLCFCLCLCLCLLLFLILGLSMVANFKKPSHLQPWLKLQFHFPI